VACYRGELLPGSYEDWVVEARAEREQRCVDLLDIMCASSSATADLARAVDAARRGIQLRPLEEVGYRTPTSTIRSASRRTRWASGVGGLLGLIAGDRLSPGTIGVSLVTSAAGVAEGLWAPGWAVTAHGAAWVNGPVTVLFAYLSARDPTHSVLDPSAAARRARWR
jgi:hypothetical protein